MRALPSGFPAASLTPSQSFLSRILFLIPLLKSLLSVFFSHSTHFPGLILFVPMAYKCLIFNFSSFNDPEPNLQLLMEYHRLDVPQAHQMPQVQKSESITFFPPLF